MNGVSVVRACLMLFVDFADTEDLIVRLVNARLRVVDFITHDTDRGRLCNSSDETSSVIVTLKQNF